MLNNLNQTSHHKIIKAKLRGGQGRNVRALHCHVSNTKEPNNSSV